MLHQSAYGKDTANIAAVLIVVFVFVVVFVSVVVSSLLQYVNTRELI